jgi:hypothetical protein
MTTHLRFLMAGALLTGTLLTGALLVGCAEVEPGGGTLNPSASSPASPTPRLQPSTEPAKTQNEITLTGTVEHLGIEGGCTVLRTDGNKVYELKGGDPQVIKVGAHVTIKGKVRNDLATICQVGPVFEVISSQVS